MMAFLVNVPVKPSFCENWSETQECIGKIEREIEKGEKIEIDV